MNAVDLFAGAGGWSLGFEQASGCSPLVALQGVVYPDDRQVDEGSWARQRREPRP